MPPGCRLRSERRWERIRERRWQPAVRHAFIPLNRKRFPQGRALRAFSALQGRRTGQAQVRLLRPDGVSYESRTASHEPVFYSSEPCGWRT